MTSFPDLETQGGNLTVEAILRGIRFAADELKMPNFRNIYIQLDNCNSNKCVTVIPACALLVKLGVCKKIKVNFLEVGHTHEDIDALIGSVVTKLRLEDLPTLQSRIDAIRNALNKLEAEIKDVEEVFGITDYKSALDHMFPPATGTKEFRIAANKEGIPLFLYKSNSTVDGWYPRPFENTEDFVELAKGFPNPDRTQGGPVHCSVYPGSSDQSAERGKRQHWYYKIRYAGGGTIVWPLKCIGIPVTFPDDLPDIIERLPVQSFVGPLCIKEKREEILSSIRSLLISRSHSEFIPTWETFFLSLSERVVNEAHTHVSFLNEVVSKVGGPLQQPVGYPENVALYESDLVPPLVVRGWTDINTVAERQEILELRAENANLMILQSGMIVIVFYTMLLS